MSGEMLRATYKSRMFEFPDKFRAEPRYCFRVIRKSPGADNRVIRLLIYIHDRNERQIDSIVDRLISDTFKGVLKQQHIFGTAAVQCCGNCHGARKRVCPFYLLSDSPFNIRRNEQWDLSERLEFQYKIPC